MKLLDYIALNIRHYSNKLRQLFDEQRIRLNSRKDYEQMSVPPWDSARINAIYNPSSLLSRLIALNNTAEVDAERILRGEICLFGTVFNNGTAEIKWNRDHFSGREYDPAVFLSYSIDQDTGADIIVPWELSRLQFIPSLIRAHQVSGNQKYAEHFFHILNHWEKANPYLFGVNWMCGLDVAIRALNIALGLIYFNDIDAPEKERAVRLLWGHLVYLQERDLHQPKGTVNNHQLIAALLHYGLLHLFDQSITGTWRHSTYEILCREMERQFHPDGGNFESALLYHQFVLEAVFTLIGLVAGDDIEATLADEAVIPKVLVDRLRKATRFTASYTKAWSGVPQIGDSSDGRIIFHRDYFSWKPEDNTYLSDWSRLTIPEQDPFSANANFPEAQLFAETGLGMFTTERYGALFSAMPVAACAAGHNHLDKTGVILQIGGIAVLVDAGTYCYTSDIASRHRHREGRAHNVLLLGKHDQAELNKKEAFSAPQYSDMGISLADGQSGHPVFKLWHDGYLRLANRGRVTRQVLCNADGLLLRDTAEGQGQEEVELIFNAHPEISVEQCEDHVLLSHNGRQLCMIRPAPEWTSSIEQGCYSSRYTNRQDCSRIVFSRNVSLPLTADTQIAII